MLAANRFLVYHRFKEPATLASSFPDWRLSRLCLVALMRIRTRRRHHGELRHRRRGFVIAIIIPGCPFFILPRLLRSFFTFTLLLLPRRIKYASAHSISHHDVSPVCYCQLCTSSHRLAAGHSKPILCQLSQNYTGHVRQILPIYQLAPYANAS